MVYVGAYFDLESNELKLFMEGTRPKVVAEEEELPNFRERVRNNYHLYLVDPDCEKLSLYMGSWDVPPTHGSPEEITIPVAMRDFFRKTTKPDLVKIRASYFYTVAIEVEISVPREKLVKEGSWRLRDTADLPGPYIPGTKPDYVASVSEGPSLSITVLDPPVA
jgi:hypothetical protein